MEALTSLTAGLTAVAFLTATLSGFSGLGGGTILMAAMLAVGMPPLEAIPLFAAVQLVSNSSRTIAYRTHVHWRAILWFTLAAVPATVLVSRWIAGIDPDLIRILLAGLVLASLLPGISGLPVLPWRPASLLAGLLNGAIGMFVGATGLFTGRLFLRPDWPKQMTIATLAMTQVIGHGLRVIAFGFVGFNLLTQLKLLLPMCLAVIAGTVLGKRIHLRIPEKQFRWLFNALLAVLALKLLLDALT